MGCDIHILLEFKCPTENYWTGIVLNHTSRSYCLFGYIAGVRNSTVIPVSEPKGFPDDFKVDYYPDFGTSAEHTQTWLTVDEMDEAIENTRADVDNGGFVDIYLRYLHLLAKRLKTDGHDVRYVIGFDS